MRVTVLVENTSSSDELGHQHGLSLFIETAHKRLLFDMGSDDLFIKNAQKLGIDLGSVDAAILSHGHWDHGGGIASFFALNDHAPLYVRGGAFGPYYSLRADGIYHWAGLDHTLASHDRIIVVEDDRSIGEGLLLFGSVANHHGLPIGNNTLFERVEGLWQVDRFDHEQYLLIEEDGKRVLITGCSHRGIVNIVEAVSERYGISADVVIGGFHLMDYTEDDAQALDEIAAYLAASAATYYTGHCTGSESYAYLKRTVGPALSYASGGTVLTI